MHHGLLVFQPGQHQNAAAENGKLPGIIKDFFDIVIPFFRGKTVILKQRGVSGNRGNRGLKFMRNIHHKIILERLYAGEVADHQIKMLCHFAHFLDSMIFRYPDGKIAFR